MKEKRLLSSFKEKKRYVVFEVIPVKIDFSALKKELFSAYRNFFGEIGLSKAGLNFVEFKDNKGILKINNKEVKNIQSIFVLLRKINKQDVIVRSLGVSGILKKARSKFLTGGEIFNATGNN